MFWAVGKRMNTVILISSLSSFSTFFSHHVSILGLSLSDAVFTTWSKSCFLKSLWYSNIKRTRQQSLSKATMRRTGEVRDVPNVEVFVWSRCCWRKINNCAWFQVHVLLTALINSLYLSNNERKMSRCWACSLQGWIYAYVICPCSRSYHV